VIGGGLSSANIVRDINTWDKPKDVMKPNFHHCPRFLEYVLDYVFSAKFVLFVTTKVIPLVHSLREQMNTTVHVWDLPQLWDCFNTHLCHSFPVPIDQSLYNQFSNVATSLFSSLFSTPNISAASQVGIGFLLRDIHTQLNATVTSSASSKNPPPTVVLYSGHDTTLLPIMIALKVFNNQWPPYGSHIEFELYENTTTTPSSFYVRMLYSGAVLSLPQCQHSQLCPWATFSSILQGLFIPYDLTEADCVRVPIRHKNATISSFLRSQLESQDDLWTQIFTLVPHVHSHLFDD